MSYLSAVDAAFLRMESTRTPMHVGGLLIFQLPDDAPEHYLQTLFERIRKAPVTTFPFNCRLKQGSLGRLFPQWEKVKNLDVDYHVRHSALPYPGGEKELGVLVSRLHSHPVDFSRPLWEFHLIEGLQNNRFALYLKAHHCAIDGIGAMKLIKRWLANEPAQEQASAPWSMPLPKQKKRQRPNPISQGVDMLRNQSSSALELGRTLLTMTDRKRNPEGGLYSALHTPDTLFNQEVSAQRRLATQLFDMKRIDRIHEATGATVNDIALSLVGAASRRYLAELKGLPEQPLIASIPIGLPRPDGKPGNAVAGFVCPLLTEAADPVQRLDRIHSITARTKQQLKGMSMEALDQLSLLGLSPLMFGQLTGLGKKLPAFFNLVVSNVVASRERLYLAGAELEAMYPISILFDGYALNVTVVGYADRLCVGFTGCRNALPSLQRLAVYTGEALDELEARVLPEDAPVADNAGQEVGAALS